MNPQIDTDDPRKHGESILWLVRSLIAVPVLALLISAAYVSWQAKRFHAERAELIKEQAELLSSSEKITSLLARGRSDLHFILVKLKPEGMESGWLPELQQAIHDHSLHDHQGDIHSLLAQLVSTLNDIKTLREEGRAWSATYRSLEKEVADKTLLLQTLRDIDNLRPSVALLKEGGDDLPRSTHDQLLELERLLDQLAIDVHALAAAHDATELSSIRDKRLKTAIRAIETALAELQRRQSGQFPLSTNESLRDLTESLFGLPGEDKRPGLYGQRASYLTLIDARDALRSKTNKLFLAANDLNVALARESSVFLQALSERVQVSLSTVTNIILIITAASSLVFLFLAWKISNRTRRQVEELIDSRKRLQVIMDNIAEGLITMDGKGTIAMFNPAAEKLFAVTATDVIGFNAACFIPTIGKNFGITSGQTDAGRVETDGKRADGSLFPIELSLACTTFARKEMYVAVVKDISARREYQKTLETMARYDALTGLFNRRELERQLDEEIARAHRYKRHLSVLMIDIDHFKQVNDRFGHKTGDQALRCVATALLNTVRTSDRVARYGGEEFVVILPEADSGIARTLAEKKRDMVSRLAMPRENGEELFLTVSIGSATFPDDADSKEALLHEADLALYEAKKRGRNQVCIAAEIAEG